MSVFISYRRAGGSEAAEKIYEILSEKYDTFLDKETLNRGYFDDAIAEAIESCEDFILIVTDKIFDRCKDQNDWILNETRLAMKYGKNIIPVFAGVDRFPENVPESLSNLSRYNGILWNGEKSCAKIESFLVSNRRYILLFTLDEQKNPILTDDTKDQLKQLFQRFIKYGRKPVHIQFQFADVNDMGETLVDERLISSLGYDTAVQDSIQKLKRRLQWYKKTLEFGTEHMLQDTQVDTEASKIRGDYIKRYGIENCFYTDDEGVTHEYWTAFAWFDITAEMLKEITLNSGRANFYGNNRNQYKEVDLIVETRSGNEVWHFSSFLRINLQDEKFRELDEHFRFWLRGDYFDIPKKDCIDFILPDLYFSIGSLKADEDQSQFSDLCRYKGIFNLMHYYIGLH